jgi:hypothetical protein
LLFAQVTRKKGFCAMSDKVVLWIGPVWPQIIAPAVPKDWKIITIDDHVTRGNGSNAYKTWAHSLGPDPLLNIAPAARQIIVAGFSRAHGAIDVLLQRAAQVQDPRIISLLALDSYYSAVGVTQPKVGYLAWCKLALSRGLPVVFTTSSHHRSVEQSASESVKPLADALALRETSITLPNLPQPVNTRGNGSVLWLDYRDRLRHEDHPLKLAQPILATGIPFRSSVGNQVNARPPQKASFASIVAKPPAPEPKPTPTPNVAIGIGLLVLAGIGAAAFSFQRVPKPKPKELPAPTES